MGQTARTGTASWKADQVGMRRFTWWLSREAGTLVGGCFIFSV